jgi:hypothetical protein
MKLFVNFICKYQFDAYLNQIPHNKKPWHIHELEGKPPDNYFKYAFPYEVFANVLEHSKYGDEFVGINYLYKFSKYFKGLTKDMRQFYIHHGLPWGYS